MEIFALILAEGSWIYVKAIAMLAAIGGILALVIAISDATIAQVGMCKIHIEGKEKPLEVKGGGHLMGALFANKVLVPSACGGQGTCGYCKVQVLEGGGPVLPTEEGFLTKKQAREHWRLSCQVKVKNDLRVQIPEEYLAIQEFKVKVVSNRNVATFIKELVMELVEPSEMKFKAGHYIQIHMPPFKCSFRDFDIDARFRDDYDKYKLWDLAVDSKSPIMRAYSMATEPSDNKRVILNVRIATPPPNTKFSPGLGSSYIFNLKPGDPVTISGPYGDFFIKETENEMMYIGGGAGMAPMRSHLFYLLKDAKSKRKITFWYGARSKREMFYDEEFSELARLNSNFKYTVALSEKKPEDNWTGAEGFIHAVCDRLYLANHPDPTSIEYYLCGPPMMIDAVINMLKNKFKVPDKMIAYDKF